MNTHDHLYLKTLVRKLLSDLPYRRDWLDPELEEELERLSEEKPVKKIDPQCIPGYQLAGGDRPEHCDK